MLKIGLLGANGRMGQWVSQLARDEFSEVSLVTVGRGESTEPLLKTQAIIDFATPKASAALVRQMLAQKGPLPALVVGSTGWSAEERLLLQDFSKRAALLEASNFSEGLFLVAQILHQHGAAFKKFGYQPFIRETHHVHKKDSPSGTALTLQSVVNASTQSKAEIQSIRAGEVIGDHEVLFFGKADRIVISHSAQDRSIFARGALRVAIWLAKSNKQAGFFGMSDYYDSVLEKDL